VLGAYEGGRAVVTLKGSMPRVAEAKKILLVMVADYRRSNHTEVMRLAHKQQAIALVGKNGKLSAGFVVYTLISSLIHSYPLSSTCSHALSFSRTRIFTLYAIRCHHLTSLYASSQQGSSCVPSRIVPVRECESVRTTLSR
jgi:hypothetical protein